MDSSMDEKIRILADQIAGHGRTVFFTGAGISTESGIPDYRSRGGIWDRFRPVYFDEFMSSRAARIEYWKRNIEFHGDLVRAAPNAAHRVIRELYEMGLVEAVITQNIDGLHQKSGLPDSKVIELHGNTLRVRCMTCRGLSTIDESHARIRAGDPAPQCECGGYLKPDTVSFGQAMPEAEVDEAVRLSQGCDCFVVVGSTLVVQPAALMPGYARQGGAFLAIINLSETPYDSQCDVLIRNSAGETLSCVADVIRRNRKLRSGDD